MGLHLFHSTSAGRTDSPLPGDPRPDRFAILSCEHLGNYLLVEIQYLDATAYGGRKLALYEAAPYQVIQAKELDPHFSEPAGPTVPIARFEPTERGRTFARALVAALQMSRLLGEYL